MPPALEDIHDHGRPDQDEEADDTDDEKIEENSGDHRDDSSCQCDDFTGLELPQKSVNFVFKRG